MAFIIDGSTGIATVDGSVSAPSQRGQDSNTGISYAADTIKFSTNGVERMAITNSGITGISAGITLADQWRMTSGFTGGADPITNNWERNDTGWSELGTGISAPSSGIFSFPSTGYYYIRFYASFGWTSSTPYIGLKINYTSNNSSYSPVGTAYAYLNNVTDTTYVSQSCEIMLKITDISNQKISVSIARYVGNETFSVISDTNDQRTGITFIRMGDI
jgi:hypothetical protein